MRRSFRQKLDQLKSRRSANQSPNAESREISQTDSPLGLKLWFDPDDAAADLIFIHGLGGHRERAWTAPSATTPWPSDILPKKIKHVRILTFGYDASVTRWDRMVSKNTVNDHALNLANSIATYREADNTVKPGSDDVRVMLTSKHDRPLLFVCHSLGGLVCQQAVVAASYSSEPYLYQVGACTRGILFMGTPLRGADLAQWASLLAQSVGLIKQTNHKVLDVFQRESETLSQIQDNFFNLVRKREQVSPSIDLACMFEELPVPGVGVIVPRESARIQGRALLSIHANHMDMTKFVGEADHGFIMLVGLLSRWVRSLAQSGDAYRLPPSPSSLTASEQSYIHLFGPRFLPMNLDDRVEGTCGWSTETSEYKAWIHTNESTILWLTGHAGCGKTTLTNFLIESLQQTAANAHSHHQAVYYSFCARDIKALRDARSLLRNMIVQVLRSKQEVIRKIKRNFRADRYELDHSFDLLWNIFQAAIASLPCEEVYIVIDAIDECDDTSRKRLLDKIFNSLRAYRGVDVHRQVVKYLISCQKTAYKPSWLGITHVKHLYLEIETHSEFINDLEYYLKVRVQDLVQNGLCSKESAAFIQKRLGALAETSFLWLRVVLSEIEQSLTSRYAEGDIERLLEDVPQSLRDAYSKYLPQVPGRDLIFLKHYLQLMVGCTRPLTLSEIDAFTDLRRHPMDFPLSPDQIQAIRSSLSKALGPLVKFSDSIATFVHSSVEDFLLNVGSDSSHALHSTHGVDSKAAHGFCAAACIRYLRDPRIARNLFLPPSPDQISSADSPNTIRWPATCQADCADDGSSSAQETYINDLYDIADVGFLQDEEAMVDRRCEDIRLHLPAFDYAAANWTYHYARCDEKVAEDLEDDSIALLSLATEPLSNWYRYSRQQARTEMPHAAEGIVLAAFFNLPRIVRMTLLRKNPLPDTPSLHDALYWAAFSGSIDCARILLNWRVPTQSDTSTKVPLAVASQGGFFDICKLLLNTADVDPNRCDELGRPPLHIAARQNQTDVLIMLLRHERIDWNKQDTAGRTALSEACRCGASESVQALLEDGRIHVNAKDGQGRTALHHASIAGDDLSLKHILANVDVDVFAEDHCGRNAVSLAAENGHLASVKRLYVKGVSTGSKDKKGRNAVSWAANHVRALDRTEKAESVLEFMARKCSEHLDEPDEYGWSPLAWALDPPGYTEAFRVLLQSGRVDVNRRDDTGRSILAWAAGEGFVDIVKLLLAVPGIQKNCANERGLSPLSSAAANGMVATVRLLLEDPEVVVFVEDHSGRRPVDWARLNNHWDVVELLETNRQ